MQWNQRKTKPRNIGIPDELWGQLGELAAQSGTGRAEVIRSWLEYAVRRPGARMPARLERANSGPDRPAAPRTRGRPE